MGEGPMGKGTCLALPSSLLLPSNLPSSSFLLQEVAFATNRIVERVAGGWGLSGGGADMQKNESRVAEWREGFVLARAGTTLRGDVCAHVASFLSCITLCFAQPHRIPHSSSASHARVLWTDSQAPKERKRGGTGERTESCRTGRRFLFFFFSFFFPLCFWFVP